MRYAKFLFATFVGAVLALSVTVATAETKPGCATVVRVEGQVEYNLGDGKWHPVVPGAQLPSGSTIRSLFNGSADIVLGREIKWPQAKFRPEHIGHAADSQVAGHVDYTPSAEQNTIRLTPDSTVSIDKLFITSTGSDSVGDTELNLTQGKIFFSVKKLTAASQYLIEFPNGIAGVRGTHGAIDSKGHGECYDSHSGGFVVTIIAPGSQPVSYVITPGTELIGNLLENPSLGQIVKIPPIDLAILQQIFEALQTHYLLPAEYFYKNGTEVFVSPVGGNHGGSGNQGGGGPPP